MKKETASHLVLIAALVFISALGRLITNHMAIYNFTAIGASALFSGIVIKDKRLAYLVPLGAMLLSDLFLELFTNIKGFYGIGMAFNYGAFMLVTWIGTQMRKVNALRVFLAAIGSGLLFFLISNFGTGRLRIFTRKRLPAWYSATLLPFRSTRKVTCSAAFS
ncbi:hypothetical protein MKQ70_08725 [Chitinophaga sedimenti]|uniref:DUF6580 family putative transport protein n=1 Tax=Chitinophaga sedimenti TaxID=2033606 RepID=UPI002003D32D|nr:DUF6580 family putative transport protein [Chitinophaga sedimenti]MCK7555087.1 hypothetical protein [Chitinophaga sedimenti]